MKLTAKDIAWTIVNRSKRFELRSSNVFFLMENVSWGLFGWGEVDLLVCSKTMYLTDIEIKLSLNDLRADFKKNKWKIWSGFTTDIKYHYYAIPEDLYDKAKIIIDEHQPNSGIIVVKRNGINTSCKVVKKAVASKLAKPMKEKNMINLARLAMFRYWRAD